MTLFGKKVKLEGPRLWLHSPDGDPLFGILPGEVRLIENANPNGSLMLAGHSPEVGWTHIRLEGSDLTALRELLPLIREVLDPSTSSS